MDHASRFNGQSVCLGDSRAAAPAPAASCGIAFMAKASAPGRAKTRLVPPLSFDEAAALNTAFLSGGLLLAPMLAGVLVYAIRLLDKAVPRLVSAGDG